MEVAYMNNYSAVRRGIESYRVMYGGIPSVDSCCYIINHIVKTFKYSGVELYDSNSNIKVLNLVYLDAYGHCHGHYYEYMMKIDENFIYYHGLKIRHYNNTDDIHVGSILHGYDWMQYRCIVDIIYELKVLYSWISNIDFILMLLKLAGFELSKNNIVSILDVEGRLGTIYSM